MPWSLYSKRKGLQGTPSGITKKKYACDLPVLTVVCRKKSAAAAGICEWVRNIVAYNKIYQEVHRTIARSQSVDLSQVQPKREALAEANEQLQDARVKLEKVQAKVAELNSKLKVILVHFGFVVFSRGFFKFQVLTDQFEKAMEDKNAVQRQADQTQERLDLAERLVNGTIFSVLFVYSFVLLLLFCLLIV